MPLRWDTGRLFELVLWDVLTVWPCWLGGVEAGLSVAGTGSDSFASVSL